MKRVFLIIFAFLWLAVPAKGAEYEYSGETGDDLYPSSEMDSLYASLPEDVRIEIADFISAESNSERADRLSEKLDAGYWTRYVLGLVSDTFLPGVSRCATLVAVILLSKIALNTVSLREGSSASGIFRLSAGLICTVAVMECTVEAVTTASMFVSRICTMMTAMLPVMEAVLLTSGSVSSAALSGTSLMVYITLTENFMRFVLIPFAGALLALGCTCGCFGSVNILSLVSAMRRVLMTVIGFFLLIFSFVLGIQNSLAKSADSLAMRSVRFAVGSYIPVVGGALSEALTTVSAGLSLIRRMVGGIGIVIILVIVLPPLVSVFVTRICLLLCKSASELLDFGEAAHAIGEADSVISVFLAFGVMSALFFIFAVILFMNSGLV